MSAVAEKSEITPDDLLAMPDEKDYELVDGRLVERNASVLSSWVGGEILFVLGSYLEENPAGLVFSSALGYQCFPDAPGNVRRSNGSFIRHERLPRDWQSLLFSPIPPDIAIEVISPNDLYSAVERKILEYLNVGVPLVWVINPDVRIVRVHRPDFTSAYLNENAELTGEDVLPGFTCRVGALFPPPPAAAPGVEAVER